jgi:hypothetical protein
MNMTIKYVVVCYVQHYGFESVVRRQVEFLQEPTDEQVEEVLNSVKKLWDSDYSIDYSSGAVLPDYAMPRKCNVKRIYAVVEKRFIEEVEHDA